MTVEAAERETKLTQMKLERDMKEKEAAAHLAMIEEKAKRVDELEGQLLLLNMDKDNLKKEINILSDQLVARLDGGGKGPDPIQLLKKKGPASITRMSSDQAFKS